MKQGDARRNPPRQRERGAGQKGALPDMADKLVFILFYFRVYPVQMAQGFFFGMGQPQANEWIHRLSPVLKAALGYDVQLPARRPQARAQAEAQATMIWSWRSPVASITSALIIR